MEDNKNNSGTTDKDKNNNGGPRWESWVSDLPPSKDLWRRVFNESLGCYEIYIRGGRVLVATGVKNEADSYIIGILPALVSLVDQILIEIKNGEVDEKTYRGLKYILNMHARAHAKTNGLD